jgi:hypothetical protein
MNRLPKLVTEVAEFVWNPATGLFETLIYNKNSESGELEVHEKFASTPRVFLLSLERQNAAIAEYHRSNRGGKIVVFPET